MHVIITTVVFVDADHISMYFFDQTSNLEDALQYFARVHKRLVEDYEFLHGDTEINKYRTLRQLDNSNQSVVIRVFQRDRDRLVSNEICRMDDLDKAEEIYAYLQQQSGAREADLIDADQHRRAMRARVGSVHVSERERYG